MILRQLNPKTLRYFSFIIVLGLAIFWQSCGGDDDEPSCAEKGYTYVYGTFHHEYDSLFPYTRNWDRLKFTYSNDTLTNEVVEFVLYQVDTFYEDYRVNERCEIHGEKNLRLYYQMDQPPRKKMRISRIQHGQIFLCEMVDSNYKLYSEYNRSRPGYAASGWLFTVERHKNRFDPHYTINDQKYFDVIVNRGTEDLCPEDSTRSVYSTRFGFIEMYNACTNELYQFLKE